MSDEGRVPMIVTVLVDNQAHVANLLPQHGYSLWLETERGNLLLDAGLDEQVVRHADILGIHLASTDWMVLSHGHYDHTGGVPAVLAAGARPRVAMHARIWEPRRSTSADGGVRSIGIPWPRHLLTEAGVSVTDVTLATALLPGVWSTGSIANVMRHQPLARLQRQVDDQWSIDSFPDEQALVLQTTAGLVVCTGCCHAGLVNTLLAAQYVTGVPQIYAIIGGLHLHESSPEEVIAVADAVRPFRPSHLWVSHCTGDAAYHLLRERLGPSVAWAGAGDRLELPALVVESTVI